MSMMVKTGTPARYIAMAVADRSEWVPMSVAEHPRVSLPMHVTTAQILVRRCLEVTWSSFCVSGWMYMLTGVEGVASGYSWIREQTAAQLWTGQSVGSWVQCVVMVSSRCSFFWKKTVMKTQSARWRKSRSGREFPVVFIETDVADLEEFHMSFARDRGVFAGAHGEKERVHDELANGTIERRVGGRGDGADHSRRDGLLRGWTRVQVFETLQLASQKVVEAPGVVVDGRRQSVCPIGRCQSIEGGPDGTFLYSSSSGTWEGL